MTVRSGSGLAPDPAFFLLAFGAHPADSAAAANRAKRDQARKGVLGHEVGFMLGRVI